MSKLNKTKPYGAVIVSWDFSNTKDNQDAAVLLVGKRAPGKDAEIINEFYGQDAFDMYSKLMTRKEKNAAVNNS